MMTDIAGERSRYREHVWFLSILLLAATVRLAFLGYATFTDEEAQNAEVVTYVLPCLKQFSFLEAMWRQWHMFTGNMNPLLNIYLPNVPIVWFFGPSEFNFRLEAAVSGIVATVLIYFLVRRHGDKKTALYAMTLVALNPFMIAFNRYDFGDSLQAATLLLGMFFIEKFREKRKVIFLLLCSFFFAIAFLVKLNAIIFVALMLSLYVIFFDLRLAHIAIILGAFIVTVLGLFSDQLGVFLRSVAVTSRPPSVETISVVGILQLLWERLIRDWPFYARAYLFYFEHTVLPLLVCVFFLRKINNKFFRVLVCFSILYFTALTVQGRTFFRYMQIGIITAAAAFAFVLVGSASRRWALTSALLLFLYIGWGLIAHATYISALYHHVPYRHIQERIRTLSPEGRILIYGTNHEAGYYFSPSSNLWLDESVDPCRVSITRREEYPAWANKVKKIPNKLSVLFDPDVARSGDILFVSGIQMSGGEPNPLSLGIKKWGIRFWGIRQYGHAYLKDVRAFYEEYKNNKRLQDQYVLLEKVFLSNGSDELAALILKKT